MNKLLLLNYSARNEWGDGDSISSNSSLVIRSSIMACAFNTSANSFNSF